MGKFSDNRLKVSTFKLNALLDITLAINDNVSTSELIRRYEKMLTSEIKLKNHLKNVYIKVLYFYLIVCCDLLIHGTNIFIESF